MNILGRMVGVRLLDCLRMLWRALYVRFGIMLFYPRLACREDSGISDNMPTKNNKKWRPRHSRSSSMIRRSHWPMATVIKRSEGQIRWRCGWEWMPGVGRLLRICMIAEYRYIAEYRRSGLIDKSDVISGRIESFGARNPIILKNAAGRQANGWRAGFSVVQ